MKSKGLMDKWGSTPSFAHALGLLGKPTPLGFPRKEMKRILEAIMTAEAPVVSVVEEKPKKERMTSYKFLKSSAWRTLRMKALIKYGARCMCCGATPATGAVMNVDHIKPRQKFPELELDINNLQILCDACNHGKGNWDQTDWRLPKEEGEHLKSILH